VVNKYVSSGAHLAGRGPVSFEAMTNAVPVFRETLEDFKLGMDQSALAGVHHPVMHGFNYSPPAAGFPGWVRFGSWLNEQNPWWPHFRRFADYSARLATVLSGSEFQASVALLGPRADEWARDGLLYQPFPELARPWYHYHLWQALQQAGFGTDYVSEAVLRGAHAADGRLRYGSRSYDTLVLMDVESLEPETAEAVRAAAAAGVHVVLVGRAPDRAPGLKDADASDRRVRDAVAALLLSSPGRAVVTPPPSPGGPLGGDYTREPLPDHARRALLQWTIATTRQLGMAPDVAVDAPSPDVTLVHHRSGERDVFFLANASRGTAVDLEAAFPTGTKRPWLWDAETGARTALPSAGHASGPEPAARGGSRLSLHLEPLQSLLLVFDPPASPTDVAAQTAAAGVGVAGRAESNASLPLRRGRDELPVVAPWHIDFQPATGAPFERTFPQLFDLSLAANDPAVAGFGGVARYRAEFFWKDASLTLLSLGTVHGVSEVRLNGRPLGVRWYGARLYDATGALASGRNVLEIDVSTPLGNLMRTRENDAATKRWAWWFPPIPSGLVGPVQLMKPARPGN
jgi:hypothetical protein